MIFIVRSASVESPPDVRVVLVRRTPPLAADADLQLDLFCVGDDAAPDRLRERGWRVVAIHDGWYADSAHGGVAVWGQGRYWEVRETPFEVKLRDSDVR
jgi:hypothetical protein